MNTELSSAYVVDTTKTPVADARKSKVTWQAPIFIRIDIKRTLAGGGSLSDCGSFSSRLAHSAPAC